MTSGLFVTGTDTGVGKTRVSAALLHKYNEQGFTTVAMKPLASGCQQTAAGLRNDDALLLQQAASEVMAYEEINPYAFGPAIAPHIAAQQAAVTISLAEIKQHFDRLAARADRVVVEGVGGWHVPVADNISMVDVARLFKLPVVMVVGMRLGCLNHALLTASAIVNDGLQLAGWYANVIEKDMPCLEENIQALEQNIAADFLGKIPFLAEPGVESVAAHISLP